MARLITKFGYIKPGAKTKPGNYSKYIATREGVEKIDDTMMSVKTYADYIATRPRAEKVGKHGLFTTEGVQVNLHKVSKELNDHEGNIWTVILSLKREDAVRTGYDSGENWRQMLRSHEQLLADALNIPLINLKWYAAFHNEGHHPHVHLIAYSSEGKQGYLTGKGVAKLRRELANHIFSQDMYSVYEQKTIYRDELRQKSRSDISKIVGEINDGTYTNYQLEAMLTELAKRLKNVNGKKVYGYLPADIKQMVDSIVDELQGQEEIAKLYDLWYQQKEEILKNYVDNLPPRVALSENKEFATIKNAVISGALHILGEDKEYPVPKTRKAMLKVSPDNQENVRAFTQLATRESASYLVSSIVNMLRDYNFRKPEEDEKISVPKTDKRKHKKKHSHGLSL